MYLGTKGTPRELQKPPIMRQKTDFVNLPLLHQTYANGEAIPRGILGDKDAGTLEKKVAHLVGILTRLEAHAPAPENPREAARAILDEWTNFQI